MPDNLQVEKLLNQLLDSDSTPEEVCATCLELLPAVRTRWIQVRRAQAELDAMFPPALDPNTSLPAFRYEDTPLPVVQGYEVETVLGMGGMGVVFRARHLGLNRIVALKMALAGGHSGPVERACLQREARAVAALRHPNVVQVHDVGDSEGRPYFTMEYVEGGSLAQKLAGTPLPASEGGWLVATLATAVHEAHRAGIVHRDLKPSNVLLTSDGVPKVSDFGLARQLVGEVGLSLNGNAVGTPSYMAPEQARGKADSIGPATDVYALGAILYEVLTGRPPFRAETAAETVHQLLTQDPVPPSRLNGKVPRDLETICLKCLHKEPRLRYATAAALADDLDRFRRGESIAARPEWRLARLARRVRRRPAFSAAVAAGVLSTAFLGGGLLWLLAERTAAARAVAAAESATERAADDDLQEMANYLRQSSWPQARAALERAKGRVGNRGSPGLRFRLDHADHDLNLVARLDAVRLSGNASAGWVLNFATADQAYEEAFSEGGLGLVGDAPTAVAARVEASHVRTALVAGLDHWSSCTQDTRREWVVAVADLAADDPTGWRARARAPAVWKDESALARIIETAPPAFQSVSFLLSIELTSSATNGVKVAFLRRVQRANPSDFWANLRLGDALVYTGQPGEAVGYYRAALVARPDAVIVRNNLAAALNRAGRNELSIEEYRAALQLDPSAIPVYSNLSILLWNLDRHDESIGLLQKGVGLNPTAAKLHTALAVRLELKAKYAEAAIHLDSAAALEPNDPETGQVRRKVLVGLGRLEEARVVWRSSLDASLREHDAWDGYAELCLFLGRPDEYQRVCVALLDRFEATAEGQVAERIGRACLLSPLATREAARAAALIDRALAGSTKSPDWVRPYYLFAKALAEYRLGRLEQAIALLQGEASGILGPAPGLVLAMAQHWRSQVVEARKTLARAVVSHDWRASEANNREKWIYHILRREAESLILPDLPAFMRNQYQPRDNYERLALLGSCQFTGRSLAQARLYTDAFAADPLLADDLRAGHRYRAACAAALTGSGRGADATHLGETERIKWRAKAREWLSEELTAWEKGLNGNLPVTRDGARQQLTQWRTSPELAGLRDAAELQKLPADERKECLAL